MLELRHILVRTDNTSAVTTLQVARKLLLDLHPSGISESGIYPGSVELGADFLSRTGPLPGEWRPQPGVVAQLWSRFGRARADLFASAETTHCGRWFSIRDDAPLGLDALSHSWPLGVLYAFFPFPLHPHVLHRVLKGCYRVLLVAPK